MKWNVEIREFHGVFVGGVKAGDLLLVFSLSNGHVAMVGLNHEDTISAYLTYGHTLIGFGYVAAKVRQQHYWQVMWREFGKDTDIEAIDADMKRAMDSR